MVFMSKCILTLYTGTLLEPYLPWPRQRYVFLSAYAPAVRLALS